MWSLVQRDDSMEDERDSAIELQMALAVGPALVMLGPIDSNDAGYVRANPKIGQHMGGIVVNEGAAKNWDESRK